MASLVIDARGCGAVGRMTGLPDVAGGGESPPAVSGIERYTRNLLRGLEALAESGELAELWPGPIRVWTGGGSGGDSRGNSGGDSGGGDPGVTGGRIRWVEVPGSMRDPAELLWRSRRRRASAARRRGPGVADAEPEVFHVPDVWLPLGLRKLERGGRRGVVTVHDVIPLVCREMLGRSRKARWSWAWRAWCRQQVRQAAAVITVSQASKRDLVRELGVAREKVTVVYNGVGAAASTAWSGPGGGGDEAVGDRAGGDADAAAAGPYVLYVGRRDPYKNVVGLVRAFATLRERDPAGWSAWRLVVVGAEDRRYPEAEREAHQRGLGKAVRFAGHVSEAELARWYAGAGMLVMPSFYEGFGLPVVEAMAAGVPVVSSDAAALPEVVGDAGRLFNPHEPGALASAMAKLAGDPGLAAELVRRGRARARRFTVESMARGHLAVYCAVAERGGA